MNKLAVTTLESKYHVYDLRTQHPDKGFASLSEKVDYKSTHSYYHLSICRSIYPSIHPPSIRLSIHQPAYFTILTCSALHPSHVTMGCHAIPVTIPFHPPIHSLPHPKLPPSNHLSFCPSILSFIHSSIYPFTNLCFYPCPFIYLFIHPFTYSAIHFCLTTSEQTKNYASFKTLAI